MNDHGRLRPPAKKTQPNHGIVLCGLYCEDCLAQTGKIADLSRDLRAELHKAESDRIPGNLAAVLHFKSFAHYNNEPYEVLGAMVEFRCKSMCNRGGGPPFCKIRKCSQGKGYADCWERDNADCAKLKVFEGAHEDGHMKNLRWLRRGVQTVVTMHNARLLHKEVARTK